MKSYLTFCLGVILTAAAHGQDTFVLWDEAVNGPLSNDSSTPTRLGSLGACTNSILGATELILIGGNGLIHEDYFTFTVAPGNEVSSLQFRADRPVAIWVGDSDFTLESCYLLDPPSGDLLPTIGVGALVVGSYGIHVGNYDLGSSSVAGYRLDFVLVPEPAAPALFLTGGFVLLAIRRGTISHVCDL